MWTEQYGLEIVAAQPLNLQPCPSASLSVGHRHVVAVSCVRESPVSRTGRPSRSAALRSRAGSTCAPDVCVPAPWACLGSPLGSTLSFICSLHGWVD